MLPISLSLLSQIVNEIKDMNTIFERPEGIWADWAKELLYFEQELQEIMDDGVRKTDLVEVVDALLDICVFAIGALHKDWDNTDALVNKILNGCYCDIHSIHSADAYKIDCANAIWTAMVTLLVLVQEKILVALFHEVAMSNMSKLKDGKPVLSELPGKFGKNMETYFKPNLRKYLIL